VLEEIMNNPYVQRVYQKLAHVRALLGLAETCSSAIPERQRAEALLEGGLLHLAIAYRFYLRELAHRYSLPGPDMIVGLEGLRQLLQRADRSAPEVVELENLEAGDGWLACMHEAELEALNPSVSESAVQQVGLIAVSSTTAQVLTSEVVGLWCQNFSKLSERQRASGSEF